MKEYIFDIIIDILNSFIFFICDIDEFIEGILEEYNNRKERETKIRESEYKRPII